MFSIERLIVLPLPVPLWIVIPRYSYSNTPMSPQWPGAKSTAGPIFFIEQYQYWAFPPGGVMPLPLPTEGLQFIELPVALSAQQRRLQILALAIALITMGLSGWLQSLFPLVIGFSCCALLMAAQEP